MIPPSTCYVLWQTKGCLIRLSLSIVFLSVLRTSSFNLACLTNNNLKKKRTCSLWIGQEVVRGLLLSALLLACLWHLGFYCSAFHQQTKTQPKQIKPSLSHSARLSHCSITASLVYMEDGNHWDVSMIIVQYIRPTACRLHSFIPGSHGTCSTQFLHLISQMTNLTAIILFHTGSRERSRIRGPIVNHTNTHHAATVCQKCG